MVRIYNITEGVWEPVETTLPETRQEDPRAPLEAPRTEPRLQEITYTEAPLQTDISTGLIDADVEAFLKRMKD